MWFSGRRTGIVTSSVVAGAGSDRLYRSPRRPAAASRCYHTRPRQAPTITDASNAVRTASIRVPSDGLICPPSPKAGSGPQLMPWRLNARPRVAGEVLRFCYSLALHGRRRRIFELPGQDRGILPAAAGTPNTESTSLSDEPREWFAAAGGFGRGECVVHERAANESQGASPSRISSSPAAPLIGLFGSGGLVVPGRVG